MAVIPSHLLESRALAIYLKVLWRYELLLSMGHLPFDVERTAVESSTFS